MKTFWIISTYLLVILSATVHSHSEKAAITPYFDASSWPDRIVVTATETPYNSFSVTWRTDTSVNEPLVEIVKNTADARFDINAQSFTATTENTPLSYGFNKPQTTKFSYPANAELDPVNYHSITFKGLEPDTEYNYRVSGKSGHWSPWQRIKTSAETPSDDFEFLYFGDAQNGIYSHWPLVLKRAWQQSPKAEFAIYAGDLVNEGANDHQWSNWFNAGQFIHSMLPAIVVPGNHEYDWKVQNNNEKQWALSDLWQKQFTLPAVATLPIELSETVYSASYPDLDIFVVDSEALGSQELLQAQAKWLDEKLQSSKAKWHIVTMHHPIFSNCGMPLNTAGQDEPEIRNAFLPVLLKHNVDLVLQGHDHSYSRGSIGTDKDINLISSPTTAKKVKSVFITSIAGPKTYPQKLTLWQEYKKYGVTLERTGENTPTYQVIKKTKNQLIYQSFTTDGKLYDSFTLEKKSTGEKTLKVEDNLPEQRTFKNTGSYQSHHDLGE